MTLLALFLAFLPVAVLFAGAAWLVHRRLTRAAVFMAAGEAFVLTLLAALWFASLGHGGWVLVFGLIGVLVAGAERGLRFALLRSAKGPEIAGFLVGVAKYLVAGALLSWRLT